MREIRPIKTDEDYQSALYRVWALMDCAQELEVLSVLVADYEAKHCPTKLADEIERLHECYRILADMPLSLIHDAAAYSIGSGDDDAEPEVVETAGWLKRRREAIQAIDSARAAAVNVERLERELTDG